MSSAIDSGSASSKGALFDSTTSLFYLLRKGFPIKSVKSEGRLVEFGFHQILVDGKIFRDSLMFYANKEFEAREDGKGEESYNACQPRCSEFLDEWNGFEVDIPKSLVGGFLSLMMIKEDNQPLSKPNFSRSLESFDLGTSENLNAGGSLTLADFFDEASLRDALKGDSCIKAQSDPKDLALAATWRDVLNLESNGCLQQTAGSDGVNAIISMKRTEFFDYDETHNLAAIRLHFQDRWMPSKSLYLGLKVKPTASFKETLLRVKSGEGFFSKQGLK